ncbi:flagellar brake protein [Bordetella sp. FB-8]|uniref:flagellar brake protein n=1 Tax=Bordetella sp. FB-8 TaxID=1159870 RepID=UPI0003A140AD|nr:flagellar brake protein [Bordetella sp. FB-8]
MLKSWLRKLHAVALARGASGADAHDAQPESSGKHLEIVHLLRSVRDEQSLAIISLNGQADNGVTTLLEVVQQAKMLVFAGLSDSGLTEQLLANRGPHVVSTSCDQVYLMFEIEGLEKTDYFGRPALKAGLPRTVTYMQRRDAFRTAVPPDKDVNCTILQKDAAIHPTAGRLAVRDLSVTGLALADPARVLDAEYGSLYAARLDIPRAGAFDVNLSVIHASGEEPAYNGTAKARRIGCSFVDMPWSVRIRIQSFVSDLQREEIMRQRGLSGHGKMPPSA